MTDALYGDDTYTIRKKILSFIGQSFHVYNEHGDLIFFCRQKGFKLKEDIRLYSDDQKTDELLTLRARNIIDWGATYDVVDSAAGEVVGSLRRKAMKSIIRDEWLLFEPAGAQIGRLYEDSQSLAILRRLHPWIAAVTPQGFCVEVNSNVVCTMKQNYNPFVHKLTVSYPPHSDHAFDRRIGIAAAVLMSAIEGRQR